MFVKIEDLKMWNIIFSQIFISYFVCAQLPLAEVEPEAMGLVPAPRRLEPEFEIESGKANASPGSPMLNGAKTYLDRIHSGVHSGISSKFISMQTKRIARLTNPNGYQMKPFLSGSGAPGSVRSYPMPPQRGIDPRAQEFSQIQKDQQMSIPPSKPTAKGERGGLTLPGHIPGIYPQDVAPSAQQEQYTPESVIRNMEGSIDLLGSDPGIYPKDIPIALDRTPTVTSISNVSDSGLKPPGIIPGIYPEDTPVVSQTVQDSTVKTERKFFEGHPRIQSSVSGMYPTNVPLPPLPAVKASDTQRNIEVSLKPATDLPRNYPQNIPISPSSAPETTSKIVRTIKENGGELEAMGSLPGLYPRDISSKFEEKPATNSKTNSTQINTGPKLSEIIPGIYSADPNDTRITNEYIQPLPVATESNNRPIFIKEGQDTKISIGNQIIRTEQNTDLTQDLQDKAIALHRTKKTIFSGANRATTPLSTMRNREATAMIFERSLQNQRARNSQVRDAPFSETRVRTQFTSNRAKVLSSIQVQNPPARKRQTLNEPEMRSGIPPIRQNSQMPTIKISTRANQRTGLYPIMTESKNNQPPKMVQLITQIPNTKNSQNMSKKSQRSRISTGLRTKSVEPSLAQRYQVKITRTGQLKEQSPTDTPEIFTELKRGTRDSASNFHFRLLENERNLQKLRSTQGSSPISNRNSLAFPRQPAHEDLRMSSSADQAKDHTPPQSRPNQEELPITRQVKEAKRRADVLNQFKLKPSAIPNSMRTISQANLAQFQRRRQTIMNLPKLSDAERKRTVFSMQYKQPPSETLQTLAFERAQKLMQQQTTQKPTTPLPVTPEWRPQFYPFYPVMTTPVPIPPTKDPNILSLSKSMDVSSLASAKKSDIITEDNYESSPKTVEIPRTALERALLLAKRQSYSTQSNPIHQTMQQPLRSPAQAKPLDVTNILNMELSDRELGILKKLLPTNSQTLKGLTGIIREEPKSHTSQDIINLQISVDQLHELLHVYSQATSPSTSPSVSQSSSSDSERHRYTSLPITQHEIKHGERQNNQHTGSTGSQFTDTAQNSANTLPITQQELSDLLTKENLKMQQPIISSSSHRSVDIQSKLSPNNQKTLEERATSSGIRDFQTSGPTQSTSLMSQQQMVDLLAQAIAKNKKTTEKHTSETPQPPPYQPSVEPITQKPDISLMLVNTLKDLTSVISTLKDVQPNQNPGRDRHTNLKPPPPGEATGSDTDPYQISGPQQKVPIRSTKTFNQDPYRISSPNSNVPMGRTALDVLSQQRSNPFLRSGMAAKVPGEQIKQGTKDTTNPIFSDKLPQAPSMFEQKQPVDEAYYQQARLNRASNPNLSSNMKMNMQMPDQTSSVSGYTSQPELVNVPITYNQNRNAPFVNTNTDSSHHSQQQSAHLQVQQPELPNTSFGVNPLFLPMELQQPSTIQATVMNNQQSMLQPPMVQPSFGQSVEGQTAMAPPILGQSVMMQSEMGQSTMGQLGMVQYPTIGQPDITQMNINGMIMG